MTSIKSNQEQLRCERPAEGLRDEGVDDLWDSMPGLHVLRVLDDHRRQGRDLSATLPDFGIDADSLRSETSLDARRVADWTNHVLARHPQRGLGLSFGTGLQLPDLGLLGYTVLSSETFGDAVTHWLRYGALMRPFVGTWREPVEGGRFDLLPVVREPAPFGPERRPYYLERWAAAWMRLTGVLLGRGYHVEQVDFEYPDPNLCDAYLDVFGGHTRFSQPQTRIRFAPQVAARVTRHANATANALCAAQCALLLARWHPLGPTAAHVRRLLLRSRSGLPELGQVAAAMGMGASTLRRQLNDEGTSFSGLRHGLRMRLAEDHLRHGTLAVGEIARRLGYADESAFARAFGRSHAMTPLAYRRQADRPRCSGLP